MKPDQQVHQQVRGRVAELAPRLVRLSHDLHAHPETAWHERRSSRLVAAHLQSVGYRVDVGAYGLPTALVAQAGARGPLVVLCCEYDALPGIGHACGHNVVAGAAVGAASVLHAWAGRGQGRVRLLGTPAEEGGGGKILLLDRGAFDGAAAVLMVHPAARDQVEATFRAAASCRFTFLGREAHAAMAPERGRNALDAGVLAYQALGGLRSRLGPGEQVAAVLPRGGEAANVVPARTELQVMCRAPARARLRPVLAAVRAAALGAATASGCRVLATSAGPTYDALRTDPQLARSLTRHLGGLGRAPRPPSVRDVDRAGSTDLGNVSQRFPVAHPMLAVGGADPHSRAFAVAAGSPAGDSAVLDGATLLALTALDVWADPPIPGGTP